MQTCHTKCLSRQVEIMMALEEKFDLQLDEEGEPLSAAKDTRCFNLDKPSAAYASRRLLPSSPMRHTHSIALLATLGRAWFAERPIATCQARRRSPPSRTLLT